MASEEAMRKLLNDTEAAYRACWGTLAGIRDGHFSTGFLQGLLQFQITLAKALCALAKSDRKLEQSRAELVKQKKQLPQEQFLSEIRRLGNYQAGIGEATRLGKVLGDAFAWFFYQNDLQRLFKHQEHEPVTEVPTGTGLDGELTFIDNVKVLDGHLVLYHGVTTILRHGDISLVDLRTFKLTCLGELKSRETGDGGIAVAAHFIGPPGQPLPRLLDHAGVADEPAAALPPGMEERFRRQLDGMVGSFKPIPFREELKLEQDTRIPILMRIVDGLEHSESVYEQCGDSLLLAGFRTDERKSLFDKVMATAYDVAGKVRTVGPYVERLTDRSQLSASDNVNSISISALGRATLPGATPLFWAPLDTSFLEKLFFQDAVVVTIYNPAHLIRKLRVLGFQVRPLGIHRYEVYKKIGGNRASLHGFDYFMRLIQEHLIDEDVVIEIIRQVHGIVESGRVGMNTRIPLYFSEQF